MYITFDMKIRYFKTIINILPNAEAFESEIENIKLYK